MPHPPCLGDGAEHQIHPGAGQQRDLGQVDAHDLDGLGQRQLQVGGCLSGVGSVQQTDEADHRFEAALGPHVEVLRVSGAPHPGARPVEQTGGPGDGVSDAGPGARGGRLEVQLLDELTEDRQPATAPSGDHGELPGALIDHVEDDLAVGSQLGPHLEAFTPRGLEVGMVDHVGHELGHRLEQHLTIGLAAAELLEPSPQDGAGPMRCLRCHRHLDVEAGSTGPSLCSQDGDVVAVPGDPRQQLDAQAADPLGGTRRCPCGHHPVALRVYRGVAQLQRCRRRSDARSFEDPVAVEHHCLADLQLGAGAVEHRSGGQRPGPARRQVPALGLLVRDQQRRRVPRGAVLHPTLRVDAYDADRGTTGSREGLGERVEEPQARADVAAGLKMSEQRAAQLSHGHRRGLPVPHDVPHHQHQRPVLARHGVEPVTAGGLVVAGQHVVGRDVEGGQHRHRGGQQGALHGPDAAAGCGVTVSQLLQLTLCRHPRPHPIGDHGPQQDRPVGLTVRAQAGHEHSIDVDLLHRPVGLVQLDPRLVHVDGLARPGRRGIGLGPALTAELLGEPLEQGLAVDQTILGGGAAERVESHRPKLRTLGDHQDERQLLERLRRRIDLTEDPTPTRGGAHGDLVILRHPRSSRHPARWATTNPVWRPSP